MNITIKQPNQISAQIIKVNRIGNRVISKEKINAKGLNINGALHSINFEKKLFTNCVKSYDKKIYKEIKEIFDELYFCNASLDDKFILLDNESENKEKEERLKDIIKENTTCVVKEEIAELNPEIKKKIVDEIWDLDDEIEVIGFYYSYPNEWECNCERG